MSGLEKIIGHISEEASEKAAILIADAEKKAEAVKNETVRKAAAEIDHIEKKADAEVSGIEERANASAELRRKQILLAGKQEIMDDVVKEAKKRLEALTGKEYEDFIVSVFRKHAPKEDAVLRLSAKAKELLSAEALKELSAIASENGASLRVSEHESPEKNGFVLDFGGIEENCSFEALFEQNREEIQDLISKKLFA